MPKQVLLAILFSEDVGGPSLQDLLAKIETLEKTKAEKWKKGEPGTSGAATLLKQTRSAAHERELRALYVRLAQLQESNDEEDTQSTGGRVGTVPDDQTGMGSSKVGWNHRKVACITGKSVKEP
ncbi:UNVERIFIED_CONTAM: hypothetical protein K2H54_008522 [Gekko kuhli]